MCEEQLDHVDENDEVIATLPRQAIHQKQLRHRAAHLLIFNDKNQCYLQKRAATQDDFPGKWDVSVSGHVDAGENYRQCIEREMQEEIGVCVNDTLREVVKLPACFENGWEFVTVYTMQAEGPFTLNPEEIDAGKWISISALLTQLEEEAHLYTGGFEQIIRAAITSYQSK